MLTLQYHIDRIKWSFWKWEMGLFWAILQGIKNGNRTLHSMQILDGEETNIGRLLVFLKSLCYVFATYKSVKFIYTENYINFQVNIKYIQQGILIASYKHSKTGCFL